MEKHKYISIRTLENGDLRFGVFIRYNNITTQKTFSSEEEAIIFRAKFLEKNKPVENEKNTGVKHKNIEVYTRKNGDVSYQVRIRCNGIRTYKSFSSKEEAIIYKNNTHEENTQIERDEIDYSEGKIYQITSIHTNLCYIGSTAETLSWRLGKHISAYNCYLNGSKKYCSSNKILELGDYKIELIENYPCKSKIELELRETHFYNILDCVNMRSPRTSRKEILEKARKNNSQPHQCECGITVRWGNKTPHKRTDGHKIYLFNLNKMKKIFSSWVNLTKHKRIMIK